MKKHIWIAGVVCMVLTATAWADWKFDFETPASIESPGYTHVDEFTSYPTGSGYGFIDTSGLWSRDRGNPNELLRDGVHTYAGKEFRVNLANGGYTVNVVGGDYQYATYQGFRLSGDGGATWVYIGRDSATDDLDNITWGKPRPYTYMYDGIEATWARMPSAPELFYVTANQYLQGKNVPITVSVGYLLIGGREATNGSRISFVEIKEGLPPEPIPTLKYDFETTGNLPSWTYTHVDETTAYSPANGYGFINTTGLESRDRNLTTDQRLDDGIYMKAGNEFRVNLTNGTYTVNVVGGDCQYHSFQAFRLSGDGGTTWTYIGRDSSTDDIDGITTGKPRPYTYQYNGLVVSSWPRVPQAPELFNVPNGEFLQGKDVPVTVSAGYLLIGARDATEVSFLNFVEIVPEPAIIGTVVFPGYTGSLIPDIGLRIDLRQGATVVRTERLFPDSTGTFILHNVTAGTYDVVIKAASWLREVVPNVTVAGSSVSFGVTLVNGDLDGDNGVTSTDLSIVLASMDLIGE